MAANIGVQHSHSRDCDGDDRQQMAEDSAAQPQQLQQTSPSHDVGELIQQFTPQSILCEDSSYFDKEWVSSAVAEAVTHFFGSDFNEDTANGDENGGEGHDYTTQQLSPPMPSAQPTTSTTQQILDNDDSKSLAMSTLRRNRSLSPTFYFFGSSNGDRCAVDGFRCSENDDTSPSGLHLSSSLNCPEVSNRNTFAKPNNNVPYQPYYHSTDFSTQTWSTALSEALNETSTITLAGAGAVLTAVLIIHPLVLVGAAGAAGAAAATAWAVGLFRDAERGYTVWTGEEFGMLFWEDAPLHVAVGNSSLAICGAPSSESLGVAMATDASKEIIEKDEEHLRRVFLSQQEQQQLHSDQETQISSENSIESTSLRVLRINEKELLSHNDLPQKTNVQSTEKKKDKWSIRRRELKKIRQRRSSAVPPRGQQTPFQKEQDEQKSATQTATIQKGQISKTQQTKEMMPRPPPSSPSTPGLRRIQSAPAKPSPVKVPLEELLEAEQEIAPELPYLSPSDSFALPSDSVNNKLSTETLLARHYPPLEHCVINQVQLQGLHTAEFFRVFFADDAIYSMRDFQKRRGDVDVVYGKWRSVENSAGCCTSFKGGKSTLLPLPANLTKERTLHFNTLTHSYFGPAYAKATKVQRATQLSNRLLVIENETQLAEIPFADRFRVVERWCVEAVRNEMSGGASDGCAFSQDMALYTSKLTVHAEVIMLRSCTWENQIRKKASETFTEMNNDWVRTAVKALRATEHQKQKRLKGSGKGGKRNSELTGVITSSKDDEHLSIPSPTAKEAELIARHRRNFRQLDKLIAKGDLEYCSIEVMHSSNGPFKVLEPPSPSTGSGVQKSLTDVTDSTISIDGSRRAPVEDKRRNRRFLMRRFSRKPRQQ